MVKKIIIIVDNDLYHRAIAKKGTRTWVEFLNDVTKEPSQKS